VYRRRSRKRTSRNGQAYVADNRVNPAGNGDYAFRVAAAKGHVSGAELLSGDSRVNPAAEGNEAIRLASYGGYTSVVKLLLDDTRVDPSFDDDVAL
jgi:hypothetical protein